MIDKNIFFQKNQLQKVKFLLPGGDEIELTELTARQRSRLQEIVKKNPVQAQAEIVVMSCNLFENSDIDQLLDMSGDLIEKISDKIITISGMGETAIEDVKKK